VDFSFSLQRLSQTSLILRRTERYVIENVLYFLLGNFAASEFYMPTFRNTLFHLHRQICVEFYTYPPMKMEQCSETSTYKIQTPENYPEKIIQHSEQGESLKQKTIKNVYIYIYIGLHGMYTLFLSDFSETLKFLKGFSKNTQI
jgi:hypothetical protein